MDKDVMEYSLETSPQTLIHYRISTPPHGTKSPLLVFLHYWGGSINTWHKLTSPKSLFSLSNPYPTVSIDFRGWGQSKGPVNGATSADYSITPLASDVVAILSHLKSSQSALLENGIVLVGHSMGAKVALVTLSLLPIDLKGLIKGLVLVAPAPPTALILPSDMAEQQRHAYGTKESVAWTVQNVLANPARLTENDIDMLVRDSLVGDTLAKDGWLLHGMREDIVPILDKLCSQVDTGTIKVSVLAGELDVVEDKDKVEREVVQALIARGFPVAFRFVVDVKHLIPLEDPKAIYDAVNAL